MRGKRIGCGLAGRENEMKQKGDGGFLWLGLPAIFEKFEKGNVRRKFVVYAFYA